MDIARLKQRLDAIAWQEHIEAELSERPSVMSPPDRALVEQALCALAHELDQTHLDALEQEPGYLTWCLRLAVHGDPAAARQRALRHLNHADGATRHWATQLAAAVAPDPPAGATWAGPLTGS